MTHHAQLDTFPSATESDLDSDDVVYVSIDGVNKKLPVSAAQALFGITAGTFIVDGVGDGVTDDTAAIQAAFNLVSLTRGGVVEFVPGKKYKITASIELPRVMTGGTKLIVRGNGAILVGVGAISILKRVPVSQVEADTMIEFTGVFQDLQFEGDGTVGQKGIDLGATYNSVIERCDFTSLDTALDLQFCLMACVRNCRAALNITRSFVARYGAWTGATNSNSQSNHTIFEQCRVYSAAGASSAFYIYGTSGCHINNCIAEGGNSVNNIDINTDGSVVVKFNKITNLHSENTPSNAVIRAKTNGGLIDINGLFQQSNCILIDASESINYGLIRVSNITYLQAGMQFKHNTSGSVFVFDFIGGIGAADLSDTAYWVGGTLPPFWSHKGHNSAGGLYQKFEGAAGPFFENDIYGTTDKLLSSTRGAAVADATGAGDVVAQLNALLARIRAHGLIA